MLNIPKLTSCYHKFKLFVFMNSTLSFSVFYRFSKIYNPPSCFTNCDH